MNGDNHNRRTHRNLTHAAVVTAALASLGVVGLQAAGVAAADTAPACSNVEIVFARGTNEAPGVGVTGQAFVNALQADLPGQTVDVYGVDYPASLSFQDAAQGVVDTTNRVESIAATCPSTKIVLGGYSQGAAVAGYTVTDAVPSGYSLPPALPDRCPHRWPVTLPPLSCSARHSRTSSDYWTTQRHRSPSARPIRRRHSSCATRAIRSARPAVWTGRRIAHMRATGPRIRLHNSSSVRSDSRRPSPLRTSRPHRKGEPRRVPRPSEMTSPVSCANCARSPPTRTWCDSH